MRFKFLPHFQTFDTMVAKFRKFEGKVINVIFYLIVMLFLIYFIISVAVALFLAFERCKRMVADYLFY